VLTAMARGDVPTDTDTLVGGVGAVNAAQKVVEGKVPAGPSSAAAVVAPSSLGFWGPGSATARVDAGESDAVSIQWLGLSLRSEGEGMREGSVK